jgi:hypothetical protein
MEDLMIIEIYEGGEWIENDFQNIIIGSKFRMKNPKTGKLFIGEADKTEFIATSTPYSNEKGIAMVDIRQESYPVIK